MTAVLPAPHQGCSRFSPDPLRSAITQRYFLDDQCVPVKSPTLENYSPSPDCPSPVSSSAPSSPSPQSPELTPTPLEQLSYSPATISSLSLNSDCEHEDKEIIFPSYDAHAHRLASREEKESDDALSEASTELLSNPPRLYLESPAADDTSVEVEPSRHVDYLSHDWKEEDIWASWRYVVARKNVYSNGVRLENASWRTWAKSKHNLGTISPETLNWLKDCDVTWLYGPLKTYNRHEITPTSPTSSRLGTPNSYLDRKPILKKKTASETILQRSLSQHTLLQHASAILKAREAENPHARPSFPRSSFDFGGMQDGSTPRSICSAITNTSSSALGSPSERRHIHFNNEVVQCIAVEAKDGDEDEENWLAEFEGDSSSDDGVVTMKQVSPKASPKNTSHGGESKTIAPLPPTTLKYRGDTPEPPTTDSIIDFWSDGRSASTLSRTPSTETIRPSKPQANFLLDDYYDGHDEFEFNWYPKQPAYDPVRNRPWFVDPEEEEEEDADQRLHLTSSGMLMPYYEGDPSNPSLFNKVVDTLNTARDIAHVIWNVGWRR